MHGHDMGKQTNREDAVLELQQEGWLELRLELIFEWRVLGPQNTDGPTPAKGHLLLLAFPLRVVSDGTAWPALERHETCSGHHSN